MKALLFSDLHCNNKQLANLYDFIIQNEDVDAIIFVGDVVNMGEPVWFMEKFVKVILELDRPFLWVPGNNDFGRAYFKLNAKFKSLESRVVELPAIPASPIVIPAKAGIQENTILDPRAPLSSCIAGPEDDKNKFIRFTGVGGSPASWAGQYEGESMIDKKAIAGSIFLSHVPPPGILVLQQKDLPTPLLNNLKFKIYNLKSNPNDQMTNDQINDKRSSTLRDEPSGSDSNEKMDNDKSKGRRFSDAPLVHICGHLHYRWGTAYLGQTKVIQLASIETGHYAILDLETLAVDFKRF